MEEKSITQFAITVLIAIVIVGAVLVPILGQVSNGGGGGSGSGESEKVVLNTFESTQGYDLTPYKSYQYYDSFTTPTLPHEITYTLEELNEFSSIWASRFEEVDHAIPILEAYDDSRSGVNISYDVEEEEADVVIMHNGSGAGSLISSVTSFNLTISTDYSLDFSYTIEYPAGSDPRTESIQITVTGVYQLSESEDGWMELSWDLHNDKISAGSEVMVGGYINSIGDEWFKTIMITEDMISNNHLQFTIDWGEGYTSDVDLELQATDMAGVWKFTDAFYDWYGTIKDNGVEIDPDDASCYIIYLSTYGYPQSGSGSGSGSGSSSGGVNGTLLAVIPIFMFLAIIVYIAQYFRFNPEE